MFFLLGGGGGGNYNFNKEIDQLVMDVFPQNVIE